MVAAQNLPNAKCIEHPVDAPFLIIRSHYLAICDQNACAAALLHNFERWHNWLTSAGNGLWVHKPLRELRAELLNAFSINTISSALEKLITKGFILSRHNPKTPFDRTTQYQFCPDVVQSAVSTTPFIKIDKSISQNQELHLLQSPNAIINPDNSYIDQTLYKTQKETHFGESHSRSPDTPSPEKSEPPKAEPQQEPLIPTGDAEQSPFDSKGIEIKESVPPAPALNTDPLSPVPEGYEAVFVATGKGERTRHYKLKGKVSPLCGQLKGSQNLEMHAAGFDLTFRDTQCPTCQAKVEAKKDRPPQHHVAIIEAYHNALPEDIRPPGKANIARNASVARDLRDAGISAEQVTQFVTETYSKYRQWARKHDAPEKMTLEHVKENIRAWLSKNGNTTPAKVWRLPDGREFRAKADGYISVELSPNIWKEVAADDAYWNQFIEQGQWRRE